MILPINEDWRITTDTYNWTVERRRLNKKQGTHEWRGESFWGSFDKAIEGLYEHRVKAIDAEGYQAVCSEIKALQEELRALSEQFRLAA